MVYLHNEIAENSVKAIQWNSFSFSKEGSILSVGSDDGVICFIIS